MGWRLLRGIERSRNEPAQARRLTSLRASPFSLLVLLCTEVLEVSLPKYAVSKFHGLSPV